MNIKIISASPKITFNNVQWLRGFSVIAVVLFHVNNDIFPNGYLGVDIFFIISGYVMAPQLLDLAYNHDNLKLRLFNFFSRRILRLAPVFLAVTILIAVLFFFLAPISDHNRIFGQIFTSYLFVGNLGAYKFGNNYFHPQPNPFLHLWSLSVEEQIYLVIPILLVVLMRFGLRNIEKFFTTFLIIFIFLHIFLLLNTKILEFFGIQDQRGFLYYFATLHTCEFLIGTILSIYSHKTHLIKLKIKNFKFIFFSAGLLLFFYHFQNIVLILICSLIWILLFFLFYCRTEVRLPLNRLFTWFGDRSYSIYLLHLPMIYLFRSTQFFDFIPSILCGPLALVLTFIISNYTYFKIENRYRLKSSSIINREVVFPRFKYIFTIYLIGLLITCLFWNFGGQSLVTDKKQIPERAWLVDENCYILSANLCKYPLDGTNKKALLIGDSHAGAISQSFIKVAHENNYSAFILSWGGCPTISKLRMKDVKIEHHKFPQSIFLREKSPPWCPQYVDKIEQILKDQKFDLLFISNDCSWCNKSTLKANALTAIDLSKFVTRGFFIGQTPVFRKPLDFNPSIFSPPGPKMPTKINEMNQTSFLQDSYLPQFFDGVNSSYISISDIFCQKNLCNSFLNGQYLFVDYNHVSIRGAELMKIKLNNAFNF